MAKATDAKNRYAIVIAAVEGIDSPLSDLFERSNFTAFAGKTVKQSVRSCAPNGAGRPRSTFDKLEDGAKKKAPWVWLGSHCSQTERSRGHYKSF